MRVDAEVLAHAFDARRAAGGGESRSRTVVADGATSVAIELGAVHFAQYVVARSDGLPRSGRGSLETRDHVEVQSKSNGPSYAFELHERLRDGLSPHQERLLVLGGIPVDFDFGRGTCSVIAFQGRETQRCTVFVRAADIDTDTAAFDFVPEPLDHEPVVVHGVLPVQDVRFGEVVVRFDEASPGALRSLGRARISFGVPPSDEGGFATAMMPHQIVVDVDEVERQGCMRVSLPEGTWSASVASEDASFIDFGRTVTVLDGSPAEIVVVVPSLGLVRVRQGSAPKPLGRASVMFMNVGASLGERHMRGFDANVLEVRLPEGRYVAALEDEFRGAWISPTGVAPPVAEDLADEAKRGRAALAQGVIDRALRAREGGESYDERADEVLDALAFDVHLGEVTELVVVPRRPQ
ncbi:MAG: hypothetical protein R3F34_02280 [Planctomycetota bacterium]